MSDRCVDHSCGERRQHTRMLSLSRFQLCVSPDYVLVPRSVAKPFYAALKKAYASFFPIDPLDQESKWGKLVNEANFKRVKRLLDSTKGEVILGGKSDSSSLRIALTIVADVKLDDSLMEE